VAELAHHYAEAGSRQKAIEYALRAGHRARLAYANQEAIAHYERVLEMLSPITYPAVGGNEGWTQRLDALTRLGQLYFALGDLAVSEQYTSEAIALGKEIELPPRAQVRLYHWLLEALYAQGRYDEEITLAEDGLRLLGDDAECVEAALMNHHLNGGYNAIGNNIFSVPFRARCAQIVRHLPYAEELLPVYWSIIIYCGDDLKNVKKANEWIQILQRHAERHHDMRALAEAYMHAGIILSDQGDRVAGIRPLRQGLELSQKIGDARGMLWNHRYLGFIALTCGDLCALRQHANRMLEIAESAGQKQFSDTAYRLLGYLHLCRGDAEKAADALRKTTVGRFYGNKVWGRVALGRAYLLQGHKQEAWNTFQETLSESAADAFVQWPFADVLSGLEQIHEDPDAFRAYCQRVRKERPEIEGSGFATWSTEPASP
jgi:tetratricopeptide (TPR) repeat protein